MRTPQIRLDFAVRAGHGRGPMGLVLLAVGAVAMLVGGFVWRQAWFSEATQARALTALNQQDSLPLPRPTQPTAADLVERVRDRATLQVSSVLQTPWSELLGALESAPHDAVALLMVEPSKAKRSVRLTAEARDPQAMLRWLATLQDDGRLSQVVMVSHQLQSQSPGAPVRFQIQASWGATP